MDTANIAAALTVSNGAAETEAIKYVGLGTTAVALLALLLAALLLKAAMVAAAVWIEATWPRLITRSVEYYHARPWRCYIAGAVNAVAGTLLALLLIASKVLALVGLLLALLLVFLVVLGFATGYRTVARRLRPDEADAMGTLVLGGIVTELVFLVPFLGQIYWANILFRGLGAATLAMLSQRRARSRVTEDIANS